MKINWKGLAHAGLSIVEIAVPEVGGIVNVVEALPGLKGKQKQDAALELIKASVLAAEHVTDRDLVDNPELDTAMRAVIDAVVALKNVAASIKHPAAPAAAGN